MANLGMIARWQMDEGNGTTVKDSSGNGNHGILGSWTVDEGKVKPSWAAGGAPPNWIRGRKPGSSALHFGGSGFIEVANAPTLEPCVLTVEAWVRGQSGHGTPGPGPVGTLLSKGAASCSFPSYGFQILDNVGVSGGLTFFVGNFQSNQSSFGADARMLWNGQWHHVAGTYDGRIVRLFVDAVEVGTGKPATLSIEYKLGTNDRLYIGAFRGTCNMGFIGDVDEVRVWKGALSLNEIKDRFDGKDLL